MRRCDVAVVGGGPAGIAAALAAARGGAQVVLLEKTERLGGNVAHALVHTICGLYHAAGAGGPALVNGGIAAELAAKLGGAPERAGRVWYLPIQPAAFAELAFSLARLEPNLELALGHEVTGAELAREVGSASTLRLADGGALEAQAVIDASGDACAAALGGAEVARAAPEALQCASFIFRLEGVERAALAGFARIQLSAALADAARKHALPKRAESLVVRPSGRAGEVFATLNLEKPDPRGWDPLDPEAVRALSAEARDVAQAIAAHLAATRPAFARARLSECAARIGVRETRRIAGRFTLTAEHVLGGRRSADEVALSSWPIELWANHRRAHFEHAAGPSSVPLGALVARAHPRLGMAGRCLSATHEALAALRVIGTALATGEAIGFAAACAVERGVGLDSIAAAELRTQTRAP